MAPPSPAPRKYGPWLASWPWICDRAVAAARRTGERLDASCRRRARARRAPAACGGSRRRRCPGAAPTKSPSVACQRGAVDLDQHLVDVLAAPRCCPRARPAGCRPTAARARAMSGVSWPSMLRRRFWSTVSSRRLPEATCTDLLPLTRRLPSRQVAEPRRGRRGAAAVVRRPRRSGTAPTAAAPPRAGPAAGQTGTGTKP